MVTKLSKLIANVAIATSFLLTAVFSPTFASSLVLNPPFGNVSQGQDLSVDVVLKAQQETVDGTDVIINYDVNVLKLKEIKGGPFFSTYPTKKAESGQIKITALAPKAGLLVPNEVVVATVVFEVLSTSDTKLDLVFQSGSTTDSNVALHGSGQDSLTEVKGGSYSVVATPENQRIAQNKKAASQISPLPIFLLLLCLGAVGIWYYLRKRKPKEDFFVPEPFPLDRPPKAG